ncbi:hypothetical protein TBLA_0B04870 [Henningerozyma blattae CBS 6284]|uniref:Sphingolipid long chain base-responsive protein LSP1 n=1 Tax=Henningerozyma blattae (strain ATCC 34711 / CBS 6284 / DSM 70876 / NBRC 10599 / NRRL Y-10934 / UCD 77-7) TaxID=1071380 RepID=I2GYW9_HENB6|nr:hypothetical protein TBLA_0B04870 [Tetrapisispora blattae CBS 6284]CCH59321.1 hypothetical protein TBLA_0B04870 [Tetrapisispora blattae CBS 6284]
MNRTYSLRNQRAPSAAQLQSPPPPPATTRSKFFGKRSIASSFRRNAVGNLGPELSRKLSQLIKTEKNYLQSLEIVANERRIAARCLSQWGYDNDDDVSDVTDKLGVLLYELGELQDQFIDKYDQYRITLKSIRNIEASVQPTRYRKDKITNAIANLKYRDPQSTKIRGLEQELVRAEAESLVAEAQLSNITRDKMKAAFNYKFDSLREMSEKFALIAGYGKALLELLDDSPVTPGETRPAYDGYEASTQIIMDAENALESWTLDVAEIKPTLSFYQTAEDVYEDVPSEEDEDALEQEEEEEEEEEELVQPQPQSQRRVAPQQYQEPEEEEEEEEEYAEQYVEGDQYEHDEDEYEEAEELEERDEAEEGEYEEQPEDDDEEEAEAEVAEEEEYEHPAQQISAAKSPVAAASDSKGTAPKRTSKRAQYMGAALEPQTSNDTIIQEGEELVETKLQPELENGAKKVASKVKK